LDAPRPGLKAFGEQVQAVLEAETRPSEQLRLARADLLERVIGSPRPQARALLARRWYLGFAGAAAVFALALALAMFRGAGAPVSFATRSGESTVGDVLQASEDATMPVTFSEGSRMVLHRRARVRVLDTQPLGARVLLEGGAVDVAVVHREQTHWLFEAGPFRVLVRGTEFELGWQPEQQLFSLHMKSGRVEVSGACLQQPRTVDGGGSVQLSCAQPSELPHAASARPTAVEPAAATSAESDAARTQARPARVASSAPPSFEQSCETASQAELVSWANRERLAGHVARARTALLALRSRFAGSSEAGTAAFTLGKMAFEQQADYAQAASWFAAYMHEQPNGPLLGDAAGRLIEAHDARGDRAAARRAAQAYLRRFPDGPYASKARRILGE
jgi:TolA-binding protein